MRRLILSAAYLASSLTAGTAAGAEYTLGGQARVRTEFRNNADLNSSTSDSLSSTHTRIRLDFNFQPNDAVTVFVQPQYTKILGDPQYVPSSSTANTPVTTSGSTNDSQIAMHQAYLSYKKIPDLTLTLGRKELNYGDQLLVGNANATPVGRAFDLVLANYHLPWGELEAFSAKIKDLNISTSGPSDKDFAGLYLNSKIGPALQNLDAYAFLSKDGTGGVFLSTSAYGLRAKSTFERFDYRGEFTFEKVKGATQTTDENQWDLEAGYAVWEANRLRVSAEYFCASDDFDQLYPTGHKWLGYAATGGSKNIAQEWDLVMTYKLPADLQVEAGASRVEPQGYMKDASLKDAASFYYAQLMTGF